jgi:hypothetical protein
LQLRQYLNQREEGSTATALQALLLSCPREILTGPSCHHQPLPPQFLADSNEMLCCDEMYIMGQPVMHVADCLFSKLMWVSVQKKCGSVSCRCTCVSIGVYMKVVVYLKAILQCHLQSSTQATKEIQHDDAFILLPGRMQGLQNGCGVDV